MKLPKLPNFSKSEIEGSPAVNTATVEVPKRRGFKSIIRWCAVGLMVLFALAMLPHFAALIFLLAALVCIPQEAMASLLAKTPLGSGDEPVWLTKTYRNWAPIAIALFLVGCITGGSAQASQNPPDASAEEPPVEQEVAPTPQEELDTAEVTPSTVYLEYSNKAVNPMSLISYDTASFECSTSDEIDLGTLGKQEVTYTLSNDAGTKNQVIAFEVRDTKAPQIVFAQNTLTVEQDSAFDPLANVTSVSDPVDGPLASVTEEPAGTDDANGIVYETGWYATANQVDTSTPGTYKVSITACDIHGNRTEKGYMVTVTAKVTETPTETSPSEGTTSQTQATAAEPSTQTTVTQDPQIKTYILNTNSRKFHLPGCSSANKIKASNRQEVEATREDLIAQGYEPCGKCNP